MKFIYNEDLTKNIVEDYYRTYEDIDGKLEIKISSKQVPLPGSFIRWHTVPFVVFTLNGSMEVEGKKQPVELVVSENEIKNAFAAMVEASGRKLKRISINYDEESFKSITVDATAKRKVR